MAYLPIEILNKILILRGMHPVAKLLCCTYCGDDFWWEFASKFRTSTKLEIEQGFGPYIIYKDYFEILCSDCRYELSKD